MKSWVLLREAADKIGVKSLAAKLNLSTALVYKWCQESPKDEPGGSGARNPLDRVKEIYDATDEPRIINWLCNAAGGYFVENPSASPGPREEHMLQVTQRVVEDFGRMLTAISRSIENDGQITDDEADHIRQTWETMKGQAETFVAACEQGMYKFEKD